MKLIKFLNFYSVILIFVVYLEMINSIKTGKFENSVKSGTGNEMMKNTFTFEKFQFDTSMVSQFYKKMNSKYKRGGLNRAPKNRTTAKKAPSKKAPSKKAPNKKGASKHHSSKNMSNPSLPSKNLTDPFPKPNPRNPFKRPLPTNVTLPGDNLRASLYRDLNTTFHIKEGETFRRSNRKWDYKVLDKQLEEIFKTLLYKQEYRMTTNGVRNYMEIFMNQYQNCDQDKDNVLNLFEFTECMTTDPYFKQIIPTPKPYASNINYTYPAVFYNSLFNIFDERDELFINFVGYMKVRLMVYSWRECSILAPYLEEADFECALEIAAGHRTLSRTVSRNIFKLTLELSNNPTLRNVDFVTYTIIASTIRLYGKINTKEDNDITRTEFNLALDDNNLPIRYNQDVIDQLFQLIDDYDRPNQGIDLESFVWYDFLLQLFHFSGKHRPYFLSIDDFKRVLTNPLFPNKTLNEVYLIPQYVPSYDSYQMYQYLNISQYIGEGEYLYKFLEVNSEVKLEKASKNTKNEPISPLHNGTNIYQMQIDFQRTIDQIFTAFDFNQDSWLSFYDFGSFMQIAYTFSKDDEFTKGKLTSGRLYDLFKTYADLPTISYRLRERSEKFNLFDQNAYIDLLSAAQIMKIDDIVKYFDRKTDNNNVPEFDLKVILSKVNMRYIPETYLNRCLRGVDVNTVPKYDWECCFVEGMNLNLKYFDMMNNYNNIRNKKLDLLNTVFYNVDPQYRS